MRDFYALVRATGWPNACSMLRPTMLQSVVLNCDRVAGACKCWANNVGGYVVLMCCDRLAGA